MVRAPVLAQELRYVTVAGFVEAHELRDKGRGEMLRVLAVGDLKPGRDPLPRPRQHAGEICGRRADRRGGDVAGDASAAV
jgi:hypothetical protein